VDGTRSCPLAVVLAQARFGPCCIVYTPGVGPWTVLMVCMLLFASFSPLVAPLCDYVRPYLLSLNGVAVLPLATSGFPFRQVRSCQYKCCRRSFLCVCISNC
jgi:hypothetical protein